MKAVRKINIDWKPELSWRVTFAQARSGKKQGIGSQKPAPAKRGGCGKARSLILPGTLKARIRCGGDAGPIISAPSYD